MKIDLPKILLGIFVIIWIISIINPYDAFTAFLENIVVFIFLPLVILSYYKFRLSNFSYTLIFIFAVLHIIATHYGYWNTPWGYWISDIFDWQRNHYDRIVHFLYGFLMAPVVADVFKKYLPQQIIMRGLFIFALIFAVGSLYEIAEFAVGAFVDPEAGLGFLGFQGDIWDTQKDMALQASGAILSLIIFRKTICSSLGF